MRSQKGYCQGRVNFQIYWDTKVWSLAAYTPKRTEASRSVLTSDVAKGGAEKPPSKEAKERGLEHMNYKNASTDAMGAKNMNRRGGGCVGGGGWGGGWGGGGGGGGGGGVGLVGGGGGGGGEII